MVGQLTDGAPAGSKVGGTISVLADPTTGAPRFTAQVPIRINGP